MHTKLVGYAVAAAAALLCSVGSVSAGTEIFDDTVATCTGINCSTLRIPGTIFSHLGGSSKPWVAQFFHGGSDCMRLDVEFQDANLEIVAISPAGAVYRNDDRTAGDDRPLVKIAAPTTNGWYTVHIGVFNGAPAAEPNFVLRYGRYSADNPNCASPTPPRTRARETE